MTSNREDQEKKSFICDMFNGGCTIFPDKEDDDLFDAEYMYKESDDEEDEDKSIPEKVDY